MLTNRQFSHGHAAIAPRQLRAGTMPRSDPVDFIAQACHVGPGTDARHHARRDRDLAV